MGSWISVLHWVHDNITLIFFFVIVAIFVAAWLIFEAFRSHKSRDEVFRLRQRLYELERDRSYVRTNEEGQLVMQSRWISVGAAATTSDGGCLILLESASPLQRKAMITIRIDGLPDRRHDPILIGQRLETDGKSGTYFVELHAVEQNRARFAISLRTRHLAYADTGQPG